MDGKIDGKHATVGMTNKYEPEATATMQRHFNTNKEQKA